MMFKNPSPSMERIRHRFSAMGDALGCSSGAGTDYADYGRYYGLNTPSQVYTDNAGTGTQTAFTNAQPLGFDKYASLYDTYFVSSALMTVNFKRVPEVGNEFVGWCGLYISDVPDCDVELVNIWNASMDTYVIGGGTYHQGTITAVSALARIKQNPNIILRRIDVSRELETGIRVQYKFTPSFFNVSNRYKATNTSSDREDMIGHKSGSTFTPPTKICYCCPFIMLEGRGHVDTSETALLGSTTGLSFNVNHTVTIDYDVVWAGIDPLVAFKADTVTWNKGT